MVEYLVFLAVAAVVLITATAFIRTRHFAKVDEMFDALEKPIEFLRLEHQRLEDEWPRDYLVFGEHTPQDIAVASPLKPFDKIGGHVVTRVAVKPCQVRRDTWIVTIDAVPEDEMEPSYP